MKQTDINSAKTKSVKGYIWQEREADEYLCKTIAEKFALSPEIAKIIATRFDNLDDIELYLNPTIKTHLPDPFHLLDMQKAAEYLLKALKGKKNIWVFGDYDVDGATSSSLLKKFFAMLGVEINIYIPDRIAEGYGPKTAALKYLKEQGADVVITVDCGTTAFEPLADAVEMGLDIIVLDHHLCLTDIPKAVAVVNPNRFDETSEYKYLAGVGVTFLLIVALNQLLRKDGFYKDKAEPKLLELLDLVALGTVCDVVPLVGLNRAFVAQGIKVMSQGRNIGINALSNIAGIKDAIAPYHLGFLLGPRINAGGRVGKSDLGANLLSSNDLAEVAQIAQKLQRFNEERKAIELLTLEEAILQVEKKELHKKPVIICASENWHAGVIGIVASRIKEKYNRPTAIIALENGIGKASCRSINGVDLGSNIAGAKEQGIIIEGGGHAMAAGFSIEEDRIVDLDAFLEEKLGEKVKAVLKDQIHHVDEAISVSSLNLELAKSFALLEPFGTSNYEPKFRVKNCHIIKTDVLTEKHVRCIISDRSAGIYGRSIPALCWNSVDSVLGQTLLSVKGAAIDLIGTIKINNWNDRQSVQFFVEDVIL
jgi:single-stranded-DNA-specific exonuclease